MTAVVLAAGRGRRMGGSKMLVLFRGQPLLHWTIQLVHRLPVAERLLVLGSQAERIQEEIPVSGWRVVVNDEWQEGMASSLRAAESEASAGGLLVFLGDMPCVPDTVCRQVIARAGDRPVAPSYRGQRGFPVYIPPSVRSRIQDLRGEQGARVLLGQCEHVPQQDPGVLWDIDRPEELACETWNSLT